jgi:predicted RNA binding protein YcfA (HicA-like mRNA interferase family)
MPGSVPVVSGAKVVKALERAGFTVVRTSGSHCMMRHADGRNVVVPVHAGRDMPKGTLRNILAIIGLTADEFRGLL